MSNLIKHSPQKEGVRRVIITTAAALHPLSQAVNATKNYYCYAIDMKGFQIEIDLQAMPPGITYDQIQPNQVWWVEKRTSLYRIYLYAGTYDPATRRIDSTDPLPVPQGSVYYGAFYDTTTQSVGLAGTPYPITYNSTSLSNGIYISNSSRVTFANSGIYNIQFSAQLTQTDNTADNVQIWLRKNGTDLTESNTTVTMDKQDSDKVAAWNFLLSLNADDYIELMWQSNSTSVTMLSQSAGSNYPSTPSIILTAQQAYGISNGSGSNTIVLTGDVTASGVNPVTTTLANTGVSAGTYGNATNIPQFSVDSKGRITGVSNVAVSSSAAITQLTGDVTAGPGTGSQAATLQSTTNVNSVISSNSTVSSNTNNLTTLSGQYVTTSGIVTNHTSSISLISGNLNTVSGTAYAALPRTGGTVTGTLTVTGSITIPIATGVVSGIPSSNFISMNNRSFIFDDGNMHITCSGNTIWLNTNGSADVQINTQSPSTGGLVVGGRIASNSGTVTGTNLSGDSGWINPSLTNSFSVAGGNTVSYRLLNNVVYLRGAISSGTAGTTAFTLPVGYRPSTTCNFSNQAYGTGLFCYITINTDGTVVSNSSAAWLNSVIFPIG